MLEMNQAKHASIVLDSTDPCFSLPAAPCLTCQQPCSSATCGPNRAAVLPPMLLLEASSEAATNRSPPPTPNSAWNSSELCTAATASTLLLLLLGPPAAVNSDMSVDAAPTASTEGSTSC
jgi:hypothetical protein